MKHPILIALVALCLPALAAAEEAADRAYLAGYAGYFDITQDDDAAAQFGLEYRFEPLKFDALPGELRPAIGANLSTDEAFYGYGGLFWDLMISDRWLLTPNFVAGGFSQGDGKDLGHAIQFRSGVELSYQFETGHRLGLGFNHISNASIGDNNPGAETLMMVYQYPLQ